MREVDFRYLQTALESLNATTDVVLANGGVKVALSRLCSPYVSRREVTYEQIAPIAPEGVIVAANFRKILLMGLSAEAVKQAAEAIGRDGRPFEDSQLGWNGPRAAWVCEPVPPTLSLFRRLLGFARKYGLAETVWLRRPLLHVAWLVPVVVDWDENGRPVFEWPDRPSEPESEPADQELPVEV